MEQADSGRELPETLWSSGWRSRFSTSAFGGLTDTQCCQGRNARVCRCVAVGGQGGGVKRVRRSWNLNEFLWISMIFWREVGVFPSDNSCALTIFWQKSDSMWTRRLKKPGPGILVTIARTMRNLTWKSSTRFLTCCWCESPLHVPWCVCFWILQWKHPKIWYLWCLPPLASDEADEVHVAVIYMFWKSSFAILPQHVAS